MNILSLSQLKEKVKKNTKALRMPSPPLVLMDEKSFFKWQSIPSLAEIFWESSRTL